MNSIWQRRGEIDRARMKKHKELTQEYDETVYYPAILALRKECEEGEGHRGGKYHDNGFGWSWFYCGKCGGRYDITGPNSDKKFENISELKHED
jgi:hypothetical protein